MDRHSIQPAPEPHEARTALIEWPHLFLIEANDLGEGRPGRHSYAGAGSTGPAPDARFSAVDTLPAGSAGYALRASGPERPDVPLTDFRVYETWITWDHDRGEASVRSPDPGPVAEALTKSTPPLAGPPRPQGPLRSDLGRAGFMEAAREAVEAGRSCVTQSFEVRLSDDPFAVYLRFRKTLAAPVTAYFSGSEIDVIASSLGAPGSPPPTGEPTFGIRDALGAGFYSPLRHAVTHRAGIFRFSATTSIGPTSDPAETYARSMIEARPLAAVLGFRL